MYQVMAYKAESYEQELINETIEKIFTQWKGAEELTPHTKVTIKPNLLMKRDPSQATTTHPSLIKGVVQALNKRGVTQITIADSPGGMYTKGALLPIYQTCGMTDAAEGCTLNTDTGYKSVENPNGMLIKTFNIINPVADADVVISVAKLKTHAMTTMSGGVKNLFGCVPGLQKPEFHYQFPENHNFCQMLVDLAETARPKLTIVDAVVAIEGDGPSAGTPRQVGTIFGCESPYPLDLAMAHMIGIDPMSVATIEHSIHQGLCPKDFSEIEIIGDGYHIINDFELPASKPLDFTQHIPGFLKPLAAFLRKKVFATRPVIRTKDCIGCGKCAESCPAKTIDIVERKAIIHYQKCIQCFCCHEMCPVKAIDIEAKGLWRKTKSVK